MTTITSRASGDAKNTSPFTNFHFQYFQPYLIMSFIHLFTKPIPADPYKDLPGFVWWPCNLTSSLKLKQSTHPTWQIVPSSPDFPMLMLLKAILKIYLYLILLKFKFLAGGVGGSTWGVGNTKSSLPCAVTPPSPPSFLSTLKEPHQLSPIKKNKCFDAVSKVAENQSNSWNFMKTVHNQIPFYSGTLCWTFKDKDLDF